MADPHLSAPDPLAVFQPGASSHPARQAWLLGELEQWFAGDLVERSDRRSVVSDALRAATTDAHRWLQTRHAPDALVRLDLLIDGPRGHRHSVFSSLPSPLALLLICLDQCQVGDEVTVVQDLAKAGRTSSTATWPFSMDEAEQLTRPAPAAAVPTR
jgi:hypothetical protein